MKRAWIWGLMLAVLLPATQSCGGCSRSGRDRLARGRSGNDITERPVIPDRSPPRSPDAPGEGGRQKPDPETALPDVSEGTADVEQNNPRHRGGYLRVDPNASLQEKYRVLRDAVFIVYSKKGGPLASEYSQGSGFFVSPEGIGISNSHVLEGNRTHWIKMNNGQQYRITNILDYSRQNDLDYVVFEVEHLEERLPYVRASNGGVQIGEEVFAIGNPMGLEQTLSTGIISGIRDEIHRIQTTTSITHGSSGGPLFNGRGEVVGITTSMIEGAGNLNFAVDIRSLNLGRYIR